MERRQFVKLAGMTSVAVTAGLAGCQDGGGNGDETEDGDGSMGGSTAPYNSWVTPEAVNNEELFVISLDTATLQDTTGQDETAQEGDPSLQEDPLATLPVGFVFIGAFSTFTLSQVGLSQAASGDDPPTDTILVVGGSLVLEGSFDPDSLASNVEASGLSEAEEYSGYTIYEGTESAVAMSDSAIVVATSGDGVTDPTGRVKAHVDANAGDGTLYSDEEQSYADLVTALPARPIMGVVHTTSPRALNQTAGDGSEAGSLANTDLSGSAHGLASSATIEQDSLTSSAAIRYENADEVDDQSTIEESLGTAADEQTVTINGPVVVIDGEYSSVPSLQ